MSGVPGRRTHRGSGDWSRAATPLARRRQRCSSGSGTDEPRCAALAADAFPGTEVDLVRSSALERRGGGDAPDVLISPLDRDLALVYPRLAPARRRAARRARHRGRRGARRRVRVDGAERAGARPAPGARLEGNDETRRRLERKASASSSTGATRSRARATAARPASPARSCAT